MILILNSYVNTLNVHVTYLFIYLGHIEACGVLVPRPGIKPIPPAVEVWSPNH